MLLLIVAPLDAMVPVPVVLFTATLIGALLASLMVARGAVLLSVMLLDVLVPAFTVQHNAVTTVPVVLLAGALLGAPLVSHAYARDAVQHHAVRLDVEKVVLAVPLTGMLLDALLDAVTVVLVALPASVLRDALHV